MRGPVASGQPQPPSTRSNRAAPRMHARLSSALRPHAAARYPHGTAMAALPRMGVPSPSSRLAICASRFPSRERPEWRCRESVLK
eukprot:4661125-Prymnesium_polylepis.1